MRNSVTMNVIRIAAGIVGIMILLVLLFSAFFIAFEVDHDCCGEDCLICARIEQCEDLLRGFSADMAQRKSVAFLVIGIVLAVRVSAEILLQETLVSRKIRLNN